MRSAPLVSADQVVAVVETYVDRVADAARRLSCPPAAVADVVEQGALAVVAACVSDSESVGDLLGRWVSVVRSLSARARLDATSAGISGLGTDPMGVGPEAASTAAALDRLDERRRLALLLRDSYDIGPAAAAVALGLTEADAQTVVAEARLRLVEALTADPMPSLAGHEFVAGIGVATLGALADGSDPLPMPGQTEDPMVRARRRHVGGCELCAAVLDGQTKARAAMAILPILGLPEEEREALLLAVATSADATLPADDELLVGGDRAEPLIPRIAIIVALVVAILIGVGVGALMRHSNDTAQPVVEPTSIIATPTASPTPTGSPTASPSATATPTTSATPTASATPSATPSASATAASAKPTPSKARKPSPTPVTTTAMATSAAPVVVPTTPATASPTPSATTAAAPAAISAVGNADGTVSVTGTGFTPNATVTLTASQADLAQSSAITDANGAFSGGLSGGNATDTGTQATVTATDGTNTATAPYTAG